MADTFRDLTLRGRARLSLRARAEIQRHYVWALVEEIQRAIYDGNRLKIDDLMPKLAEAMAQDYRAAVFRDH